MPEEEKNLLERPDYEEELISILQSDESPEVVRERLEDYHYSDIADVIEQLSKEDRLRTYRILGLENVAELFTHYEEEDVARFIDELDVEIAADVLETMDADEAVDILEELDEEKRAELTRRMDKSSMEDIRMIQSYDEDEIGSRMSTNFIVIHTGLSIKQVDGSLVHRDGVGLGSLLRRGGHLVGCVYIQVVAGNGIYVVPELALVVGIIFERRIQQRHHVYHSLNLLRALLLVFNALDALYHLLHVPPVFGKYQFLSICVVVHTVFSLSKIGLLTLQR